MTRLNHPGNYASGSVAIREYTKSVGYVTRKPRSAQNRFPGIGIVAWYKHPAQRLKGATRRYRFAGFYAAISTTLALRKTGGIYSSRLCSESGKESRQFAVSAKARPNVCQLSLVYWESSSQSQVLTSTQQSEQQLEGSMPNTEIWTRKKATERDNEATKLMLAIREKLSNPFNDKKTRKAKLWNDNSKKLEENNFKLGEKGGERCRQKFANLQKAYLAYIKHQRTTGSERNDDLPPFFEELHSILGGKHKVTPRSLEDSMDVDANNDNGEKKQVEEEEESAQTDAENTVEENVVQSSLPSSSAISSPSTEPSTSTPSLRFKKISRKLTPSRNDDLIKKIQNDRTTRKEEFGFIKEHMLKSEQQKERFLDILEVAFGIRKRKREDSSESE